MTPLPILPPPSVPPNLDHLQHLHGDMQAHHPNQSSPSNWDLGYEPVRLYHGNIQDVIPPVVPNIDPRRPSYGDNEPRALKTRMQQFCP